MTINQLILKNDKYVIELSEPIEIDKSTAQELAMNQNGGCNIAIYCLGREIEKLRNQVAELKAVVARNHVF